MNAVSKLLRIYPFLSVTQAEVLAYARSKWPNGFTYRELAEDMGSELPGLFRLRCKDLASQRLLEDSGVRRTQPGGKRRYIVWRFKPRGRRTGWQV